MTSIGFSFPVIVDRAGGACNGRGHPTRVFGVTMNLFSSLLLAASIALPPAPFVPWPIDKPARELLTNFNAGEFDLVAKDFNKEMRATTTPALLKKVKQDLDAQAGAFKEVTETRHTKDSGFKIVDFLCAYEKGPVEVMVTFDHYDHVGAISVKRIVDSKVDAAFEATARQFVDDFTARRFEVAGKGFDANMRRQLTPEKLAELSQGVAQRYGTFKSVAKVTQRQQKAYQVIEVTADFDRSPAAFSVYFDGAGRIAGVHIEPASP
ncbi:MAG TPA: DUF3887 domain-containing protein [Vicinamibacterales bacterium]